MIELFLSFSVLFHLVYTFLILIVGDLFGTSFALRMNILIERNASLLTIVLKSYKNMERTKRQSHKTESLISPMVSCSFRMTTGSPSSVLVVSIDCFT
jgi:hypothetical protein